MSYNISLFIFCAKYPMKQHEGEGLIRLISHDRKSKVAGGSLEGEILLTSQKKEEAEKGDPGTQGILFPPSYSFWDPKHSSISRQLFLSGKALTDTPKAMH